MLGKIIDIVLKKNWSGKDLKKYLGNYKATFLAYANNLEIRENAASGGLTTTLLIEALKEKYCDGVVVCKSVIKEGKVRPIFFIAKKEEEILSSQGSKYIETDFLRVVPNLIRNFSGKIAVVGLPCDIKMLKLIISKDESLKSKVVLTIALFCGHNSRKELIDNITRSLENKTNSKIKDFIFRKGTWRGNMYAYFENGYIMKLASSYFNLYHNLFFFCQRKCLSCNDHFGYYSDISIGDIWLYRFRNDKIKKNSVIIRSDYGLNLFNKVKGENLINSEKINPELVLDGQTRIAPFHYNVSARAKAGKLFGLKIVDKVNEKVNLNNLINAFITILNIRLSENKKLNKIIFLVPKFLLKICLYFKKALEVCK